MIALQPVLAPALMSGIRPVVSPIIRMTQCETEHGILCITTLYHSGGLCCSVVAAQCLRWRGARPGSDWGVKFGINE